MTDTSRSGATPTAPRKQDPPWAAWLGPALGALAVILKATGCPSCTDDAGTEWEWTGGGCCCRVIRDSQP